MIDNAKKINLLIQNAVTIEKDTERRKTALLNLLINDSHIKILKELEGNNLQFFTEIIRKNTKERISLENLQIGDDVVLDLSPSFLQTNFNFNFYFNFNEFIEKNNTSLNDEYFYILDKKITSFQTSENKYLQTHSIILKLQDILKDIADDVESQVKNKIYTIFDSKKIKITSDFNLDDIEFILEKDPNFGKTVSNLYDELELKSEKKTRSIFFKKSLELTFKEKNIQMSDMLKNLEKIFTEYESHYRAYINSLEPEKIKAQFEEEHTSFLKDLNIILGDVHNKIIFIPIAFIFGASQLTTGGDFKGGIIITGMLTFTIFVHLFLRTHRKVLDILNSKIKDRKEYYEDKEPTLFKKYKSRIEELLNLSRNIDTRINIIKCSNWILTIGASIFFIYINYFPKTC